MLSGLLFDAAWLAQGRSDGGWGLRARHLPRTDDAWEDAIMVVPWVVWMNDIMVGPCDVWVHVIIDGPWMLCRQRMTSGWTLSWLAHTCSATTNGVGGRCHAWPVDALPSTDRVWQLCCDPTRRQSVPKRTSLSPPPPPHPLRHKCNSTNHSKHPERARTRKSKVRVREQ